MLISLEGDLLQLTLSSKVLVIVQKNTTPFETPLYNIVFIKFKNHKSLNPHSYMNLLSKCIIL